MDEFYPELAAWRAVALTWLSGETHDLHQRLQALLMVFERYLIVQGLPLDPGVFLAQTTHVPNFLQTACLDSPWSISANNLIHAFPGLYCYGTSVRSAKTTMLW